MNKITCAIALFLVLGAGSAFGAATKSGNVIRMTAEADTWSPDGAAIPPIVNIQLTPVTTGTCFRLREYNASGKVLWETTSTETRPVSDAGTVITAVGGLDKISENVTLDIPQAGIYLDIEGTDPSTWTGIYLYFREDN